MVERTQMRVSDSERQAAVDRLRVAHDEGRLDLDEYDRRLAAAYASKTYGDLDQLFLDLPAPGLQQPTRIPAPRSAADVAERPCDPSRRMPLALRILWINYAAVLVVNIAIWWVVSGVSDVNPHFWPVWLLIPGAALATVTAGVQAHRRSS